MLSPFLLPFQSLCLLCGIVYFWVSQIFYRLPGFLSAAATGRHAVFRCPTSTHGILIDIDFHDAPVKYRRE